MRRVRSRVGLSQGKDTAGCQCVGNGGPVKALMLTVEMMGGGIFYVVALYLLVEKQLLPGVRTASLGGFEPTTASWKAIT